VEVVLEADDLGFVGLDALDHVAPLAGGLDGGLDRLRAGVHGQHQVQPAQGRDLLGEGAELIVVEGPRGEGQALRLLDERAHDLRVGVPEVEGRVAAEKLEVPLAVDVLDPASLPTGNDHGQGRVVAGAVTVDQVEVARGLGAHGLTW
jgi:hypothetical protein